MTIQEFISACAAGGTINVDSDIDFNSYNITTSITIAQNTTINGNGHILSNLQSTNTAIFQCSNYVVFNNVIFQNVYCPTTNSGFCQNMGGFTGATFNTCTITGIISQLSFGSSPTTRSANFNQCNINIERFYQFYGEFTECYITLNRNNYKSGNLLMGASYTSCYITGDLTFDGNVTYTTKFNDCCVNWTISGGVTVTIPAETSGSLISVFNTTKNDGSYVFTSPAIDIGVTDAQMHDAQSLSDVGFTIYVP